MATERQRAQRKGRATTPGLIPPPNTPSLEDKLSGIGDADTAKWRAAWKPWDLFWLGLDWRTWPADKPVPRSRWYLGTHSIIWDDGTETPVDRTKCATV
jgi:hypothetical protein